MTKRPEEIALMAAAGQLLAGVFRKAGLHRNVEHALKISPSGEGARRSVPLNGLQETRLELGGVRALQQGL